MWPILLSPSAAGYKLNVEVEVPINPCDHLWLPTNFDPSVFDNSDFAAYLSSQNPPWYASPLFLQGGSNTFPLFDTSENLPTITAPTVALRFNSKSNPWTVWTLNKWNLYAQNGDGDPIVGIGDFDSLRSISGVITRLWVKWINFSNLYSIVGTTEGMDTGSRILLMSSIGMNESTVGASVPIADLSEPAAAQINDAIPINASFAGGGYTTPQMNTQERAVLETLGQPGSLSGTAGAASGRGVRVDRAR